MSAKISGDKRTSETSLNSEHDVELSTSESS